MEGRRQGGDQRRLGLMLYRCEDVIMRPSVFYTWKLKKMSHAGVHFHRKAWYSIGEINILFIALHSRALGLLR